MNIIQLANLINIDLDVVYIAKLKKWHTEFDSTEVMSIESEYIDNVYGIGETQHESIADYVEKIRGKILVDVVTRKTHQVPEVLFYSQIS